MLSVYIKGSSIRESHTYILKIVQYFNTRLRAKICKTHVIILIIAYTKLLKNNECLNVVFKIHFVIILLDNKSMLLTQTRNTKNTKTRDIFNPYNK